MSCLAVLKTWSRILNLRIYLRILRKGILLVVGMSVLGALAGAAYANITPRVFQTQAIVYVNVRGASSAADLQAGNVYVMQKTPAFALYATTDAVLNPAARSLSDGTTADGLRAIVQATAQEDTGFITISGSDSSPQAVATRVNAVAAALVDAISASAEQPSATSGTTNARLRVQALVAQRASIPGIAAFPQPRYSTFAGGVVGLALALVLLLIRHTFDTRIYSTQDMPLGSRIATKIDVPNEQRWRRSFRRRSNHTEESLLSAVRADLQFGSNLGKSVAVIPAGSDDSVSDFVQQLAEEFVTVGKTVITVDADFRQSVQENDSAAGVATSDDRSSGLVERLRNPVAVEGPSRHKVDQVVHRISSGRISPLDHSLLSTSTFQRTVEELSRQFDLVFLICAPLTQQADSLAVVSSCDSALLVVRAGHSDRVTVRRLINRIVAAKLTPINVVVDGVDSRDAL